MVLEKSKKAIDADIILVDMNHEYTIDASKFESMGKNTPLMDGKLPARSNKLRERKRSLEKRSINRKDG